VSHHPADRPVPSLARASARKRADTSHGTNDGTSTERRTPKEEHHGNPKPPGEANAHKADDTGKETVIILAQDFRLAEVLAHIEAGRIVLVIPAPRKPAD
jgi:hypothetical protein